MRWQPPFKVIAGGKRPPLTSRRDRRTLAAGLAAGLVAGVGTVFWPTLLSMLPERDVAPAPAVGLPPSQEVSLTVIDGDTLEDLHTGVRYRVANIDTPETGERARCAAEREAAAEAKAAARAIIASARELIVNATGRIDQYGRTIAFVEVDGRDFGRLMIEADHARPWRGRRKLWCDGSGGLIR
jgi:endonuclease YncB( thermonuclease family)